MHIRQIAVLVMVFGLAYAWGYLNYLGVKPLPQMIARN